MDEPVFHTGVCSPLFLVVSSEGLEVRLGFTEKWNEERSTVKHALLFLSTFGAELCEKRNSSLAVGADSCSISPCELRRVSVAGAKAVVWRRNNVPVF